MAASSSNSLANTADSHKIPLRYSNLVLTRLPAKSLIRFKSVSKSFFRVISCSGFHYLNSLSQLRPSLIFRLPDLDFACVGENFRLLSSFCTTDLEGNILSLFDVNQHEGPIKLMLPSCMGLICFATNNEISLCNPIVNEQLEMPSCDIIGKRLLGFGFGYLYSIKGFKVVRLMTSVSEDCLSPKIDGWVFTLPWSGETRSWRLVEEKCPYLVAEFSYPAFANETIYWKIDRSRYSKLARDNDFIVSFNIREEKFGVITHPDDWTDSADSYTHIIGMGEFLCLVNISDSCVTLWCLTLFVGDLSIWSAPVRMCQSQIGRPVRLRDLKSLVRGGGDDKLLFGSEQNSVVFYGKQETYLPMVFPFYFAEFTPCFECLYPLIRN